MILKELKKIVYLPGLIASLPSPKFLSFVFFSRRMFRRWAGGYNLNTKTRGRGMRILVVKLYGLGNMVLFIPTLKGLRSSLPEAEITLMINNKIAGEIISDSGLYDKLKMVDITKVTQKDSIKSYGKINYDLVLLSYPMLEKPVAIFAGLLQAKYKVGHNFIGCPYYLFDFSPDIVLSRHEVEMNLDLLRHLKIDTTHAELDIHLSQAEVAFADMFFQVNNLRSNDFVIALVPGSSQNAPEKRWPISKFIELGKILLQDPRVKLLILGDRNEVSVALEIAASLGPDCKVASGQTGVKQAAALIKNCSLFISGDTGLMHVANAVQTPLVALFGPTITEKNYPWGDPDKNIVVRKGIECSPCYAFGIECKQTRKYCCMSDIEVNDVLAAIDKLIEIKLIGQLNRK